MRQYFWLSALVITIVLFVFFPITMLCVVFVSGLIMIIMSSFAPVMPDNYDEPRQKIDEKIDGDTDKV